MAKPSFREACYELLRKVPPGRVTTYGDLAAALGRPGAARAVGTAMAKNEDAPRTPCHRVVSSDGRLNDYSAPGGVRRKMQLLVAEGVRVDAKAARVLEFERARWRP